MTMILDLPGKLQNEILYRVPLESMRAVRLTCTKWNTLSKSRSFSEMQIGKIAATREGEFILIVSLNSNHYLMSVVVNGDPSAELKGKFICLNEQVIISRVFVCEGLLLCNLKDDMTKVVVWNPYLGQTSWIKSRYVDGEQYRSRDWYLYALGYVNKENTSCRSYKILRFVNYKVGPLRARFPWYEIYDFDSGLWTTLDVVLPSGWDITSYGVSLKGNTYFCVSNSEERNYHMICFDFTSERFGPIMRLPFDKPLGEFDESMEDFSGQDDYVTLSCVREEKLAVLLTHNETNPYEVDIWITTKIEAKRVTWSKFMSLDTYPEIPISSQSFFIDEEKKVAMGFDFYDDDNHFKLSLVGEGGDVRKLVVPEQRSPKIWCSRNMYSYVPSLVQIKQFAGGKRKQQSDLEKHRFDEKMAKLAALEKGANE